MNRAWPMATRLTRDPSTLGHLEPNVQPTFYCFSSVNEREHIRD